MRHLNQFATFFRSLFEPNPVLHRELRARWRRPVAFLTLFFYAAPLALAMVFLYGANASDQDLMQGAHSSSYNASNWRTGGRPIFTGSGIRYSRAGRVLPSPESPITTQLDAIGKRLFTGISLFLAMAWLLIAPATAAPMLAMERERGLLEALQLANLPARRVAMGKWIAAMAFSWTLLFVPLPIIAICFLFGGISQMEFAQVAGTVFLTALNGAALGLFFSARRSRPATALRDTFLFVVMWSGVAFFPLAALVPFDTLRSPAAHVSAIATVAHPVPVLYAVINNYNLPQFGLTAMPIGSGAFDWREWPIAELWVVHLGLQAAMALFFLSGAIRAAGRVLPEPIWVERRRWVESLRTRWQTAPGDVKPDDLKPNLALRYRAQNALLIEIPLLSRLERPLMDRSFDNPVLGRELRARLRLRGASWWIWLLRLVPIFCVLIIYMQALANAFYGVQPRDAFMQFAWLGLCGLSLYAAVTGAGGFTRERESGTWEGIRLSLLHPREIVHGKFWPLAGACFALSLPLILGFLTCVKWDFAEWDSTESSYYSYQYSHQRFSLLHAAMAYILCLSAAFFASATALLVSWFSRRTSVAVGLTTCALAVWFFGVPLFFSGTSGQKYAVAELSAVNPVSALAALSQPSPRMSEYGYYDWYNNSNDASYINARARYQEVLNEYHRVVRGIFICPISLLVLGSGELLLIGALMRQRFRDEK